MVFDAASILDDIDAATGQLLATAAGLGDADVRQPSRLPDWSRGHVLTHLARNADGGRRLLGWARTGVEDREYPSPEARAAEIEAGSGRSAAELLDDLRASADRFAAEYRRMPSAAWEVTVRWTRGQEHPAARIADSRLTEVLLHHVDLDAGFGCGQWPPDFVRDLLGRFAVVHRTRADAPAVRLLATDTGERHDLASGDPQAPTVAGPQADLLGWLTGRSDGAGLDLSGAAALPRPPAL